MCGKQTIYLKFEFCAAFYDEIISNFHCENVGQTNYLITLIQLWAIQVLGK